ncbi:phytase [uncultured Croceicoccus sp.]|uniref:phytase n=1 Tax=uncultured Croceicoccus sp. TaxID=1295329 RepID=UPI002630E030|nr:phytase [uncultured Croceicoccus sp.]
MRYPFILTAAALISGCASVPAVSPWPTQQITADTETDAVGTTGEDAADDPAIWRNAANPVESLIVATDKKAGLYVYGLDGTVKSFAAKAGVNNVDLIEVGGAVLVGASDRADPLQPHVALYTLDTGSGALSAVARLPVGVGEGYGFCMGPGRAGGELARAYLNTKDGLIVEAAILGTTAAPTLGRVREMRVPSQPEGCVVDGRTGMLYVGEEAAGIWRFDLSQDAPSGTLVAAADGMAMVPDVEGLTIAAEGADAGFLIASSQGDNAYALFRLPDMAYLTRFRVVDGGGIDGTSETDGIAFHAGDFGPAFTGGLFVAQDGDNGAGTQNFKLIDGAKLRALVP